MSYSFSPSLGRIIIVMWGYVKWGIILFANSVFSDVAITGHSLAGAITAMVHTMLRFTCDVPDWNSPERRIDKRLFNFVYTQDLIMRALGVGGSYELGTVSRFVSLRCGERVFFRGGRAVSVVGVGGASGCFGDRSTGPAVLQRTNAEIKLPSGRRALI